MDAYSIAKFLHVICAIAWVGGGLTLLFHSIISARARGAMETLKSLDVMNALGKAWFVPASMLTLLTGVAVTALGGLWLELWVVLGLAGFASTFFTGLLIIEPVGRKIGVAAGEGRMDEALAQGQRLLSVAKFDYTVMLVVVADMVLKPHWSDLPVLLVFALAIGAGAWFFLLGGRMPARPQAA